MGPRTASAADRLRVLTELCELHAQIAGDAVEIAPDRWALYGTILVDGNVLVAEYDSAEEAREALAGLPPQRSGR